MTSRCPSVRSLRVPEDPLRTTFLYGEMGRSLTVKQRCVWRADISDYHRLANFPPFYLPFMKYSYKQFNARCAYKISSEEISFKCEKNFFYMCTDFKFLNSPYPSADLRGTSPDRPHGPKFSQFYAVFFF